MSRRSSGTTCSGRVAPNGMASTVRVPGGRRVGLGRMCTLGHGSGPGQQYMPARLRETLDWAISCSGRFSFPGIPFEKRQGWLPRALNRVKCSTVQCSTVESTGVERSEAKGSAVQPSEAKQGGSPVTPTGRSFVRCAWMVSPSAALTPLHSMAGGGCSQGCRSTPSLCSLLAVTARQVQGLAPRRCHLHAPGTPLPVCTAPTHLTSTGLKPTAAGGAATCN